MEVVQHDDFALCKQYVMMYEMQRGLTMQDVAEQLGVSRTTLYNMRSRWRADGLLQRMRQIVMTQKYEDLDLAIDDAFRDLPQLVSMMVEDARTSSTAGDRRRALDWLWKNIYKPRMDEMPDADTEELAYLENHTNDFAPTDIPLIDDVD